MTDSRIRSKFGAVLWLLCAQFFVAELITASSWPFPYSWANNYISDLGALHCAVAGNGPGQAANPVCSPWHGLINLSFVLQGALAAVGVIMNRRLLAAGLPRTLVVAVFVFSGIGYAGIGLVPNDVNLPVHFTAAAIAFFGAATAMILLGMLLLLQDAPGKAASLFTVACGILAFVATILFASNITLTLGIGGMERVAFYPFSIWLILAGMKILRSGSSDDRKRL